MPSIDELKDNPLWVDKITVGDTTFEVSGVEDPPGHQNTPFNHQIFLTITRKSTKLMQILTLHIKIEIDMKEGGLIIYFNNEEQYLDKFSIYAIWYFMIGISAIPLIPLYPHTQFGSKIFNENRDKNFISFVEITLDDEKYLGFIGVAKDCIQIKAVENKREPLSNELKAIIFKGYMNALAARTIKNLYEFSQE